MNCALSEVSLVGSLLDLISLKDKRIQVPYNDGRETGQSCTYQGKLEDMSCINLRQCQRRNLILAIYAQKLWLGCVDWNRGEIEKIEWIWKEVSWFVFDLRSWRSRVSWFMNTVTVLGAVTQINSDSFLTNSLRNCFKFEDVGQIWNCERRKQSGGFKDKKQLLFNWTRTDIC